MLVPSEIGEAFAIGFLATAGLMPLVQRVCFRWRITAPRAIGEKSEQVPSLGGPPIIGGALGGLAATTGLPLWLVIAIAMLCAAGVIDDIIVLTPMQKIAAEAVAAAVLVFWGPRFVLSGFMPLDLAIAGIWLVATANAFNLIDGLDGLAGGIGVSSAVTIAAVALLQGDVWLASGAGALAGALLGFLFFNLWPASIFMGDSGALPIGMLLGILALAAGQRCVVAPLASYVFPVLVLLTPLLDTGVVTISRIATGQSISRGAHDHSHHRLLRLGLSTRSAVAVSWAASVFFALCAVAVSRVTQMGLIAMLPFMIISAAVLALFMVNLTFDEIEPGRAYASMGRLARVVLRAAYQWRIADVMLDGVTISAAYIGAYLIRLDFRIPDDRLHALLNELWQVLLLSYAALFISGVYRSIWRYTEVSDVVRFAKAAAIAGGLLAELRHWQGGPVSWSIVILFSILLSNLLVVTRISFTVFRRATTRLARNTHGVLIVGAGATADAALQLLMSSPDVGTRVIGLLDDDRFKQGMVIRGVPVLGPFAELERLYRHSKFEELLLASSSLTQEQIAFLHSFARQTGVGIRSFVAGGQAQLKGAAGPTAYKWPRPA
jgi:UDP-GlcNAc:undecaprenyl-phosphate/decaprenyl-phosphate GlcNAc-1-phosphate transferase